MTEDIFWQFFELAWKPGGGWDPYDKLSEILEKLPLEELLIFSKIYSDHQDAFFTPAHLCAAYLINLGVLGDEEFNIYTEALAGAPRKLFMEVMQNADNLLDYPIYERLLNFSTYPFGSLPATIGEKNFSLGWLEESKKDRWKTSICDIDRVEFDARKGAEIATPELCQRLVPRLYNAFESRCDWSVKR